jgi:EmrB/QacA subfamily drug resistance transporter
MYVAGFLLFVLSSVLCGLSQSLAQLIVFRILQAVAGSLLFANGRAIATVAFPPEQRGKALGISSMAFHVGYLTGPTLGGFLIDSVGWRSIFYVNAPFGLLGAYLAWKHLADTDGQGRSETIDYRGALLLLLVNTSFLYATNQLPHLGLGHPLVVTLLLASVMTLLLFIWNERRAQTPILSLSLFRNRLFTSGILSLFFISSTQAAIQFLMPFYLQSIMGFTPTQMGWIIIANSVVIVMVAPVAGWLSDRLGSRLLCTAGSGLIVLAQFQIASLNLHSSVLRIVFPLAISGLGWAIFNSPNQSAVMGAVGRDQVGAASGATVTTARIGISMGLAISATLFTYGLAAAGLSRAQADSPQLWASSPDVFMKTFNHTVHTVNLFALLSVFFSALRGGKKA